MGVLSRHTPECVQKCAKIDQQIREWEARWPNYCRQCYGYGAFFHPATREEPESSDPCDCTLDGVCPRCGITGLNEDGEGPCDNCGWNYNDAKPEIWDCWGCRDDEGD